MTNPHSKLQGEAPPSPAPTCPDCGELPPCKHIAPEAPPSLDAGLGERIDELTRKIQRLQREASQNALTPEEWERHVSGTARIKRMAEAEIGLGVYAMLSSDPRIPEQNDMLNPEYGCRPPYLVLYWETVADRMAIHDPRKLAALCLHQQPFGFSQADVELLRDQAAIFRGTTIQRKDGEPEDDQKARLLASAFIRAMAEPYESLASRISALLPQP